MKLKPLHYILIAILVVELVVFSVLTFTKDRPDVLHELSVTYENKNGTYTLQSILDDAEEPSFSFERAGETYTFNGSIIDYIDYFRDRDEFLTQYPNTTEMVWTAYKQKACEVAAKAQTSNQEILQHLSAIGTSWYSVNSTYLPSVAMYTICFNDTYEDWSKIFKQYETQFEGTTLQDVVLPADVILNNQTYPALAYMSIHDNMVTTYILFGYEYLQDFHSSVAEVIICSPDKTLAHAHTYITTAFAASSIESRYREALKE